MISGEDVLVDFWRSFVPLFVAVDAIGLIPLFMAFTEGVETGRVRSVIFQSVMTAFGVALFFIFAGPALLRFMGVTVADFMIAGGILLLVISMTDILAGEKRRMRIDPATLGAIPIGVPLMTGPAVLTTSLLLVQVYGRFITSLAILVNILIAWAFFLSAGRITALIGTRGAKIVSKIMSLILASIAVMLVRKGISEIVLGFSR